MWMSPDVPSLSEEDCKKLLNGFSHRSPVKIEENKLFVWYSFCSRHFWHDPECKICQTGGWQESSEDNIGL